MKPPDTNRYPDVSDIHRLKAETRKERARLSFGEKILRMEALRERVAPIKLAREKRRAARRDGKPPVASE